MTLDEYKKSLSSHDWTYMMSDDHSVYCRGEAAESALMHQARAGGDEYKRAFNRSFAAIFHRDPFVEPYNFPFPEVQPQETP